MKERQRTLKFAPTRVKISFTEGLKRWAKQWSISSIRSIWNEERSKIDYKSARVQVQLDNMLGKK